MRLQVKRADTLKEQVYRKLKTLLTTGQLDPAVYYSANQFAERLGVSRTPAREALLQLEAEGFLIAEDNRGFRVKEFSEKEARDFFEMRRLMETYAISRLCETLSDEHLQQLRDSFKRMKGACERRDVAELIASDEAFHLVIVSGTDNLFLKSLIRNIRDFIAVFGRRMVEDDARMDEVVEEHEQILKALAARDKSKAADAMARHLQKTEARLLQSQTKESR
ncbi:MAG TPA: GntR family transcriptional regulator [Planctomycetota bacterium]|nr:GntR family transcriptional regulator [Planctomycetota bacterium]